MFSRYRKKATTDRNTLLFLVRELGTEEFEMGDHGMHLSPN
jgi:hypothetical protein